MTMKYILLLFVSVIATLIPIISFSQEDYPSYPTITQQIPLGEIQPQQEDDSEDKNQNQNQKTQNQNQKTQNQNQKTQNQNQKTQNQNQKTQNQIIILITTKMLVQVILS